MGAAQSKNIANAITNVTNSISQSTTADTNQVNNMQQDTVLRDCQIKAQDTFEINQIANTSVQNSQILKAIANSSIQNKIAQKLAQEALSQVGALGIGYSDASNEVNTTANASTTISNAMATTCNQMNYTGQHIVCNRSTIEAKNIFLNQGASSNFISSQVLDNKQVVNLVNDISQDVSQKASAKVSGILGMIVLILFLLVILGLSTTTGILSSPPVIILTVFILLVVTTMIFVYMYIKKTPPFFSTPNDCVYGSSLGGCDETCVDMKQKSIPIKNSPLKYNYPILPTGTDASKGNLLMMAISSLSEVSGFQLNGAYNQNTLTYFEDSQNPGKWAFDTFYTLFGVPQLPNPLTVGNGCYLIPSSYRLGDSRAYCTPTVIMSASLDGTSSNPQNCPSVNVKCEECQGDEDNGLRLAFLNMDDWRPYLESGDNEKQRKAALHARFVLSQFLNLPCNIYIFEDELIKLVDSKGNIIVGKASEHQDKCLRFTGFDAPRSYLDGIISGGFLVGNVGVCNTNSYKFQNFMRKIGIWLLMLIIIAVITYIIVHGLRKNNRK